MWGEDSDKENERNWNVQQRSRKLIKGGVKNGGREFGNAGIKIVRKREERQRKERRGLWWWKEREGYGKKRPMTGSSGNRAGGILQFDRSGSKEGLKGATSARAKRKREKQKPQLERGRALAGSTSRHIYGALNSMGKRKSLGRKKIAGANRERIIGALRGSVKRKWVSRA